MEQPYHDPHWREEIENFSSESNIVMLSMKIKPGDGKVQLEKLIFCRANDRIMYGNTYILHRFLVYFYAPKDCHLTINISSGKSTDYSTLPIQVYG